MIFTVFTKVPPFALISCMMAAIEPSNDSSMPVVIVRQQNPIQQA